MSDCVSHETQCPFTCLAVEVGEGLYFGVDPFNKGPDGRPKRTLKSKGVKQRVHMVKVVDGWVWVQDSAAASDGTAAAAVPEGKTQGSSAEAQYEVASDQYAHEGFARTKEVKGLHSHRKDGSKK